MNGNGCARKVFFDKNPLRYVPVPECSRLRPGWLIFVSGDKGWINYGPFMYGPDHLDRAIEDVVHGINEDIVRLTDRDVVTITEAG